MIGLAKKLGFDVEQYGYNVVCTYSPDDKSFPESYGGPNQGCTVRMVKEA